MSSPLQTLLTGCALSLLIAGCATPPQPTSPRPEQGTLQLEAPGEQVRLARSGRFVIQASSREQPDVMRGGHGRFEWLSMTPANTTDGRGERQIMIWLGPLGQTLGSLERRARPSNTSALLGLGSEIRAFDAEGLMLNTAEQQRMLIALLGTEAAQFNAADIDETLTLLMISMEQMSRSLEGPREFRFRIHRTDIVLRAVLDPA